MASQVVEKFPGFARSESE